MDEANIQFSQQELVCDYDQVDTITTVAQIPNDTCVGSHVSPAKKEKKKEPDTQKHLLHLPHTWLSNQFAAVKNTLAAFSHESKWRAKGVVGKVH